MQVLNISWNNIQNPLVPDPQAAQIKKEAREKLLGDIEAAEAAVTEAIEAAKKKKAEDWRAKHPKEKTDGTMSDEESVATDSLSAINEDEVPDIVAAKNKLTKL